VHPKIAHDITMRKLAEETLVKSEKAGDDSSPGCHAGA
jgi:hypothetical protein